MQLKAQTKFKGKKPSPGLQLIGRMLLIAQIAGCAGAPKVPYSQLQFSEQTLPFKDENIGIDYYKTLIKKMRGLQFGDLIFKRNSSVYWILPEIDKVELEITAKEADIGPDEYQSRLKRFQELHHNYLVFSIDLRMPFYSGWTQNKLFEFIKSNLVVTLENGTHHVFLPENIDFNIIERYQQEEMKATPVRSSKDLEVRVPLRAIFNKVVNSEALVSESTKKIIIKLRLRKNPPFKIGYFDDKFFQGFLWKIVPPQENKKAPSTAARGPEGGKK
ncbi:MAG: hypothetical protein ACE5HX_03450 [bacterium]